MAFPAVYDREAHEEPTTVSPPRELRSTDLSRLRAQAGTIVAIVAAAIGIVFYMERSSSELRSDVRVIITRLDERDRHERELKEERKNYMNQLAKTLEAQIKNAGLQNAALNLTQELDNLRARK